MEITPSIDVALLYGHSGHQKLCKSGNGTEAGDEEGWHVLVQSTKPGVARLTASCSVDEIISAARQICVRDIRIVWHGSHHSRIEALNRAQREKGSP